MPAFEQMGFEDSLDAVRTQMLSAYQRLQNEPRNHDINGHVGMLLLAYSKNANSEVFFRRAHILEPGEFRWTYYLATAVEQLGRYDEATSLLNQALSIEPESIEARLRLANVLLQNNQYQQSAQLYETITLESSDRVDAWLGLGKALDGSGNLEAALNALTRAKDLGAQYGDVRYALAGVLSASGNSEQAAREFAAYEKRARVKVSRADRYTRSVTRLNASDGPFLAKADYQISRGQFGEAVGFFRRALEINPDNQDAWGGLVFAQSKLRDKEATKDSYLKALAAGVKYKRLHFTYAQALQKWGNIDEARQIMAEAIKLDPRYTEALVALGTLELERGETTLAVTQFTNALAVTPNDRKLRLTLAQALLGAGQYEQAVTHLEPLSKDPNARQALACKELATAYKQLGRRVDAVSELKRARDFAASDYNSSMVESIDALLLSWRGQ